LLVFLAYPILIQLGANRVFSIPLSVGEFLLQFFLAPGWIAFTEIPRSQYGQSFAVTQAEVLDKPTTGSIRLVVTMLASNRGVHLLQIARGAVYDGLTFGINARTIALAARFQSFGFRHWWKNRFKRLDAALKRFVQGSPLALVRT
jgi:hypothetical protein